MERRPRCRLSDRLVGDLAVHKRKVDELEAWIASSAGSATAGRLLCLRGPPGSGRSTALREIAARRGWDIREWAQPCHLDTEMQCVLDLEDFLLQAQLPALNVTDPDGAPASFIVIDDLPATKPGSAARKTLDGVLEGLVRRRERAPLPVPVVVVLSTEERFGSRSLTGAFERGEVPVLEFRSLPDGAMKKVLREAVKSSDPTNSIPPSLLDEICAASGGDVRSALFSLEMSLSVGGGESAQSKPARSYSSLFVRRDFQFDVFRTAGKVLYPKFREASSGFVVEPEEILAMSLTSPGYLLGVLFTNYLSHFLDLDDIVEVTSCLSDAELLSVWQQDSLSRSLLTECAIASVGCRSIMIKNRHQAKKAFRPIRGMDSALSDTPTPFLGRSERQNPSVEGQSCQNWVASGIEHFSILANRPLLKEQPLVIQGQIDDWPDESD